MKQIIRITEDSFFKGTYSGYGDIELYGKFHGSLYVENLYVKKSGVFIGYLSAKNIRVNGISPGMIASPFNQRFAEGEETGKAWESENLIGRWGQSDDITGAAIFLASDESRFITGSDIEVEGGWLAARSRPGEEVIWED